jgi:hypothetical protein
MSADRRDFFKKVAGAAATLASVEAVLDATGTTTPAAAADKRGFVAARVALELDGAVAGFVQSTEGGDASADVVEEELGSSPCLTRKHLANVKYDRRLRREQDQEMGSVELPPGHRRSRLHEGEQGRRPHDQAADRGE